MRACKFPHAEVIGKPSGWDDELDGECLAIYVMRAVDTQSGIPFMYSFYKPSEADIEALRNGGVLRLGISGRAHPIFQLNAVSPGVTATIDFEPGADLGEVI